MTRQISYCNSARSRCNPPIAFGRNNGITIYLNTSAEQFSNSIAILCDDNEIHECAKKCLTCLRVNVLCREREKKRKTRRVHKLTRESDTSPVFFMPRASPPFKPEEKIHGKTICIQFY